eukprot:307702_1
MAQDSEATSTMTSSPSLFLPDSVPDEFKDNTFLDAIKSAKQTLGSVETGLSAKSEFELYFQTGPSTLDYTTLHKRAQNVDIRHSKIRSVYWKVFLSVIGNDTASWKHTLHKKRAQYTTLKDKYINDAMKEDDDSASNLIIDNPLLSTSGGKWDKYYKDNELRDTIVLDVDRTYPEDDFFVNKIVQNSLTDILFIYCKENEWISYKQGMNEIIAALFMVNTVQSTISPYVDDDSKIKTDHNTTAHHTLSEDMSLWETVQDIRYIEHDTYFMFREIMNIMGQYFINATGKEVPPVVERSKRIQGQFLRQMDTQLAQHLLKINLTPQLYGLRWIRLFFSREFHLRDVCVVWDAIFGAYSERKQAQQKNMDKDKGNTPGNGAMDPSKAVDYALDRPHKIKLDFRFVDYMSCSMLLFIRHQLIGRDISHCLRRVMRYPPIEDVASLIERAYTIRDHIERRGKKSKSKTAMSNNLNIADRWNQFSRTVSSAMTTYAEDVKSLMGGQRRTLKSRMQFEYALGTKMGQVLKHVQGTINNHRGQLNDAFMSETLRTAAPMMDTNEIKSNANAVDSIETDSKEDQERHDPLSTTSTLEDPLEAKPKPKQVEEENPLLVIEEALAELKLVKDALMGNLDETQLESWLDWTFVEPSPEPKPNENAKLNKHKSSPPLLGLIK